MLPQIGLQSEKEVAYFSWMLSHPERIYCVIHHILLSSLRLQLQSPPISITWLMSFCNPASWRSFEVQHRPGMLLGNADTLSRVGEHHWQVIGRTDTSGHMLTWCKPVSGVICTLLRCVPHPERPKPPVPSSCTATPGGSTHREGRMSWTFSPAAMLGTAMYLWPWTISKLPKMYAAPNKGEVTRAEKLYSTALLC